jgi:hypothetical protein
MASSTPPSPDPPPADPVTDPPTGPPPGGMSVFAGLIGLLGAVVGIVAAVSTWHTLENGLAKAFAIAGIVVLALVAARLYQAFKSKELTRWAALDLAGVGTLCACITVVLASVFGPLRPSVNNELPKLRFVSPPLQPHECAVYKGIGTIPKGYDLLIFDSPARNGQYFWDGKAVNQPSGGWQTPLVMAGNDPTWISAILVPFSSYKFVRSIRPVPTEISGKYTSWISHSLPLSKETIAPVTVVPLENGSGCPPAS